MCVLNPNTDLITLDPRWLWPRGILIPVNTSRAGPCIPAVLSILSIVNQVEAAVFLFSTPVMTLDWAELSAN